MGHLQKLQDIAGANGGTRAAGTSGYDQSVQFVADTLRDAGFDVTTPSFELNMFRLKGAGHTVGGKPVEAAAMEYSQPSPAIGATGPLVVVPSARRPVARHSHMQDCPSREQS
jgi:hypothetical protein